MGLRDYQQDIVEKARLALTRHKRVLIQAPTGAGKTVLASFIMSSVAERGQRGFFICHRRELIDQTSGTFTRFGIPHSFIAAGYPHDPTRLVQICSVDTLKNRLGKVIRPELCIWDEAHHLAAAGWARVHDRYSDAFHVGLSATPERLDGQGLRPWFDTLVLGPTVHELIESGQLAKYRLWSMPPPEMSGVRTQFGEYAKADVVKAIQRSHVMGDAVTHWQKHAAGRMTIGFAASVDQSVQMAQRFTEAGISSAHLDGYMPKDDRKTLLRALALGHISVIWNVDLFSEGFDIAANSGVDAAVGAVIDLAPTKSLGRWLQRCGRALRPQDEAVILDHAGNALRHGLPCAPRDWSLDSKPRAKRLPGENDGPSVKICKKCYFTYNPAIHDRCPSCGYREPDKFSRVQIDGELEEMKRTEAKTKRQEQGRAETMADLINLGYQRGYKNPRAWAYHVMKARRGRHGHSRDRNY